jgi:hypothetical protein
MTCGGGRADSLRWHSRALDPGQASRAAPDDLQERQAFDAETGHRTEVGLVPRTDDHAEAEMESGRGHERAGIDHEPHDGAACPPRARYDRVVDSVADRLRDEDRRAVLALSSEERVRLALALGERDLDTFRLSHVPPLTRHEAARRLERQRQTGRRPSGCMSSLAG